MKNSPSIWSFFIERRPVAWLTVIAIAFIGIASYSSIPREIQPEVNIPTAIVTTVLPGANPADVESLITEPLETEIAGLSNVKKMTSTSSLSLSNIIIEFDADADITEKVNQLKDRVDIAKNNLPEDASEPNVFKVEANGEAIITVSLSSKLPLSEISKLADEVKDEFETISGVSEVEIIGKQQKVIDIALDPAKVEQYGLSLSRIAGTIDFENANLPLGIINSDATKYSVRVDNRLTDLDQINKIPLFTFDQENGGQIYLGDIARISIKNLEQEVYSRLSESGEPANQTISLKVYKRTGGNAIELADAVKAKVEELKATKFSANIDVAISNDNSEFIRTDLGILTNSGIQTTILIAILLFVSLGLVEGILAAITIPLTLMMTVAIVQLMGLTINGLTLFAAVIALGLMVDTAIVVMEGINDGLKSGLKPREAALKAIHDYKAPLIAGTLTTVFAFLPMLFVDGILGEFLKALPITISAALISSLFISLTIMPSIGAKLLEKRHGTHKSLLEPMFNRLGRAFKKLIDRILATRLRRILTIFVAIILFFASMSLPVTGILKAEMFPKTDFQFFIIQVELPKGGTLADTDRVVAAVEEELYQVPEIASFLTIIGSGSGLNSVDLVSVGGSASSNLANITVNLVKTDERELRSYEITEILRKRFEAFTDAKVTVQEFSQGPPSEAPINVRIIGDDLETIRTIAADLEAILAEIPGTQNIKNNLSEGLKEFKFTLDRERLSELGISSLAAAAEIRTLLQGVEASEITINDEELKLFLHLDLPSDRNTPELTIDDIKEFSIGTPSGPIKVGAIAELELQSGLSAINHEDEERVVKVSSEVTKTANSLEITALLQAKIADYQLPSGYKIEFGGDTAEIQESFKQLFLLTIIGVILVAFTLVVVFNSLSQPFIILLTLPLAIIGVFPGLALVGLALSFPAFLGITALAGVVVNDAIVLIDQTNINRQNGMSVKDSVANAAQSRVQPIFMTTITTVVGILPLALSNEFWAGLGFTLVFGLIAATGLTLIVMPVLYYMFTRERKMDNE